MTNITPEFLEPYFHRNKVHVAYKKCCEMYDNLRVHANGEYPAKLIDERRPSESETIKDYRKQIYEPVTKDVPNRMISSFSKIRRSEDWSISFPKEVPSSIASEETPQKYFEEKYPYFNSITNWTFAVLLRNYLLDANALILVLPTSREVESNEYLQPYPYIFNSPDVIDYIPGDFAILRMQPETEELQQTFNQPKPKYLVVSKGFVHTYAPDSEGKYILVNDYRHGLNRLPIADVQAIYLKSYGQRPIFESQIYAIVPHLNKAVREDSDLDGVIVQHAHPKYWEYGSDDCTHCANPNGISTGFVDGKKGKVVCPKCRGSKKVSTSPYSNKVVRSAKINMGEQPVPTPPMGFVELSPEAMKFLNERIQDHLFSALASKNMQFLMQTPTAGDSGYKVALDKDELNNTVHSVAEDLVSILDRIISISIDYRYLHLIPSEDQRKKLRPAITVPERFDLLSSDFLMEELTKAKQGNTNKTIIYGLEKEFIAKKFHSNPEIRDELNAILELDPMPYNTEDEKMTKLSNGGVTLTDYIISCNIVAFVCMAAEENKGFYQFEDKKKRDILVKYAEKVKLANEAKAGIAIEPPVE